NMLKTRSLVTASEGEKVWIGVRAGDRIETMTLGAPNMEVEASDAAAPDLENESTIMVRIVDDKLNGFAFGLSEKSARTLATMLLAIAGDYEVAAVSPKDETFLKVFDQS